MEAAALAVSAVALVVAAVAYWRQVTWARVAADAQERLAQLEGERRDDELRQREQARMHARFEREGNRLYFIVENHSEQATAHDVNATLAAAAGLLGVVPRLLEMPFPTTIGPKSEIRVPAERRAGTVSNCNVTVTWWDDVGNQRQQTYNVATK
jgi:hypothetical protein